ncbi:hypothetical protein J6590_082772 [Homalodisca vitripennis]|nr:hypothetical protein J6590_082772 [Homalodisca vitripennis]
MYQFKKLFLVKMTLCLWNQCRLGSVSFSGFVSCKQKTWLLTEKQQNQVSHLKGLPIIHHDGYVCQLPPKHRFPMRKFDEVFKILEKDGIISKERQLVEPSQITEDIACNVHTPEYIDKFFNGKTSEVEQRATGFVWTAGLASRVRYETAEKIRCQPEGRQLQDQSTHSQTRMLSPLYLMLSVNLHRGNPKGCTPSTTTELLRPCLLNTEPK